jgi:outer membrane protein OmpA-like peptidoglycan-associated protein/tetratricopeptide (TPR) repeat protein
LFNSTFWYGVCIIFRAMKKNILLFIFCFLFVLSTAGQESYSTSSRRAIGLYKNAGREYQLLNYQRAVELLLEATKIDNEFIEAWLLLGQVYTDANSIEKSIDAYKTAINLDAGFFPPELFLLAENEFSIGRYQSAREHMKTFLALGYRSEEMKAEAVRLIENCNFSIRAVANPVPFEPVNLGNNINTRYDEYWPSLSVDESMMVLTRQIPIDENNPRIYMNRQEDFYFSEFKDGEWQPAKNAGYPPNTPNNEGAQAISANGKYLFFTACNRREGLGGCDLYYSEKDGDRWSIPVNLGRPVNSGYNEKQPSVSADGSMLYFVSDRPGGKGKYDVWISQKNIDGTWMDPVNAGDSINTPGDEQSPFIHQDNQTLYFCSTGWPGLGRYDIYLSKKKDDQTWSEPVNLGYPINTYHNEEGLIVNASGNKAYFSSDRVSGQGRDIFEFDLYEKIRPVKVSYMKGKVYDAETWQRLQARFELIDLNTGETVMISNSEAGTGEFLVCIPADTDYALNVSKKGYLFYSDHFSVEKVYERNEPYLKDVPLQPIKIGQHIILRNVFFAYNSYELQERSEIELNRVLELMNENPSLVVEISGHTDNTGTPEYNQGLSERRAGSVKNYLIENGISSIRMTAVGYGLTKPIASNETEEGRAENRRTELKILEQ